MIMIKGFLERKQVEDAIDVILKVDVIDEFYYINEINKLVFPVNKWTVCISQDEMDRESKDVWACLCNEDIDSGIELLDNEVKMILEYIKDNELDRQHGLVLSDLINYQLQF